MYEAARSEGAPDKSAGATARPPYQEGVTKVHLVTTLGDGSSHELPFIIPDYSNVRKVATKNQGDTVTPDPLLMTTVYFG